MSENTVPDSGGVANPRTPIEGKEATERFVDLLTGGNPNDHCHWRRLDDSGGGAYANVAGPLAKYWSEFERDNGFNRISPFLVINGGGTKKSQITHIRSVCIDSDSVPLPSITWHRTPCHSTFHSGEPRVKLRRKHPTVSMAGKC